MEGRRLLCEPGRAIGGLPSTSTNMLLIPMTHPATPSGSRGTLRSVGMPFWPPPPGRSLPGPMSIWLRCPFTSGWI